MVVKLTKYRSNCYAMWNISDRRPKATSGVTSWFLFLTRFPFQGWQPPQSFYSVAVGFEVSLQEMDLMCFRKFCSSRHSTITLACDLTAGRWIRRKSYWWKSLKLHEHSLQVYCFKFASYLTKPLQLWYVHKLHSRRREREKKKKVGIDCSSYSNPHDVSFMNIMH